MVTWISHDTDSFIVNEGITSIGKKVSRVVHAPLCVQHRASLEIRDKPHQVIKKSPMQKHQGFFSELKDCDFKLIIQQYSQLQQVFSEVYI